MHHVDVWGCDFAHVYVCDACKSNHVCDTSYHSSTLHCASGIHPGQIIGLP